MFICLNILKTCYITKVILWFILIPFFFDSFLFFVNGAGILIMKEMSSSWKHPNHFAHTLYTSGFSRFGGRVGGDNLLYWWNRAHVKGNTQKLFQFLLEIKIMISQENWFHFFIVLILRNMALYLTQTDAPASTTALEGFVIPQGSHL